MTWRYLGEDEITLHDGRVLKTHGVIDCGGDICVIHNQTQHHMQEWPLNWRWDREIMERMCPHDVGHPDPDDYRIRTGLDTSVHACDGCCHKPK